MKEAIKTDAAPSALGPYSQAIATEGFLFCAGQTPLDPATGDVVAGDISVQTERVLENVRAVLRAAGLDLGDVVKTTCYLADMDAFADFNAAYASYFSEPYPARTTIQAARLPLDVAVEIEVIAKRR